MEFLKEDFEEEEALLADRRMGVYAVVVIWSILLALFLIFACSQAKAEEYTDNQIADAIYKAENSKKYPYGVKSINTHGNKDYARKICLNSIRNARKRCEGRDLIACMGERYSPPATNPNWVRLVKYFLNNNK